MTEFLIRRWIPDPEAVTDSRTRIRYSDLAGGVGIFCNLCLFLLKWIAGTVLGSLSVTADAFNNLSDAFSSLVSIIGPRLAAQPADREHPFGHGRIEYLSALLVALVITGFGGTLFRDSLRKILHPEFTELLPVPLGILLISVAVKCWISRFDRTISRRISSGVLRAAAEDARNDACITAVTILVLLTEHFFRIHADGIAGMIVSLLILQSAVKLLKETLRPLIGGTEDSALSREILQIAESSEFILGTHDLIIHDYGPGHTYASLHAEMPAALSLTEAHRIIDDAEYRVQEQLGVELNIHIDPVDSDDRQLAEKKEELARILAEADPALSFHDLHIVQGRHHQNCFFEVVLPYGYTQEQQDLLAARITAAMQGSDPSCHCHIRFEHSLL